MLLEAELPHILNKGGGVNAASGTGMRHHAGIGVLEGTAYVRTDTCENAAPHRAQPTPLAYPTATYLPRYLTP